MCVVSFVEGFIYPPSNTMLTSGLTFLDTSNIIIVYLFEYLTNSALHFMD